MATRETLNALGDALRRRFVERDAVIDAVLTALVAGQHVLLIGPPGTAKSEMASAICDALEGAEGFSWLLTRFTTPEELFGPVSLQGLEEDRYARITAGKLPEAHVVFLDEVFKASSAILNTLLTVLNERKFHNDRAAQPVPLVSLFGATNGLPDEDELQALYDRFLVRVMVDYVEADFRFLKLLDLPTDPPPLPRLSLTDLDAARAAAAALPVASAVYTDLVALRRTLAGEGIVASDRRWRQALGLLRARAWLDGRAEVTGPELEVLRHVLWQEPEERDAVIAALEAVVAGSVTALRELVFQARELAAWPAHAPEGPVRSRAALEAYTKLNQLRREAGELIDGGRRHDHDALQAGLGEIDRLRAQVAALLETPLQ